MLRYPVLLLSLSLQLAAQAPMAIPAGTFVQVADRGVEAEGRDWHASFGAAAVTFAAALGERAPRTATLALALLDHGRAGHREAAGVAAPTVAGSRVRYARPGVDECFDVRADGLELSLGFATRPAGEGDLVVRYRVTTALPVTSAAADGVRWADEYGGVRLGGVVGIDRDGHRVGGAIALAGDELSLVLPAAFVDAATYPLVLDPLIGATFGVVSGFIDSEPAAAFDTVSQRYLLAWRRTFSATQSLIRAQLLTPAGSPTGPLIAVDPSAPPNYLSWRPSVAARAGEFYVGWSGAINAFLVPNVYAARVSTTGVASGQTLLYPQEGFLDLSCSPATNLVVFATWSPGLFGRTGNLLWNGTAIVPQTLRATGFEPAALSRGGAPTSPFVANLNNLQRLELGDVQGAGATAVVQQSSLVVDGVAIAMTDATHGVIVWAEAQVQGTYTYHDLYARAFHLGSGASGPVFDTPQLPIATDIARDERAPTIVALGGKYGIAWQSSDAAGHIDTFYCDFAPDCQSCGTVTRINAANAIAVQPVLVGRTAALGQPTGDAMLFAVQAPGILSGGGTLVERSVTRFVGGPIVDAGPGCGFAGTFDTVGGPAALGNPDFTYRLTNYPAGGLAFFLLGLPGGETTCGLCTFVNPIVTQYVAPTSPTEVLRPMPLPCRSGYLGLTLAAQWIVFGAAATPCPAAPSLIASRRLHATLDM